MKNALKTLVDKLEGWDKETAWFIQEAKLNEDGTWSLVVCQATDKDKEKDQEEENA